MIGGPEDVHQPATLPWYRVPSAAEGKMSGGNGVDIAAVYTLLRQVADRVIAHDDQLAQMRLELQGLQTKADKLAADMRDVKSQLRALQSNVQIYTGSVFAQGVRIEEIDERLRRVEQHLNLAPGK